jgi:AraC family transcriptional regulator
MEHKIVDRDAFKVIGISAHGNPSSMNYGEIWSQFESYDEQVKKVSLDKGYYNVYFGTEEEDIVDLVAGMAVEGAPNVPEGLTIREVPAMRCAVFECTRTTIGQTYEYVYRDWLPRSQYEHDDKPDKVLGGEVGVFRRKRATFEYFPPDTETEDSPVFIHVGIKGKSSD